MNTLVMFKESLYSAFYDWLKTHRQVIGDKWFNNLLKQLKKSWQDCKTVIDLIAISMWFFNIIANFGIMAGLGPGKVTVEEGWIPKEFDEKLTKRVLLMCSSCLALQGLHGEGVPEGNAPWRFKLSDYIAST